MINVEHEVGKFFESLLVRREYESNPGQMLLNITPTSIKERDPSNYKEILNSNSSGRVQL